MSLAASFRDKEKELQLSLESAKANWERQMQQHREIVNEEKVAEVVAMMTGVPVQRIAQALREINFSYVGRVETRNYRAR